MADTPLKIERHRSVGGVVLRLDGVIDHTLDKQQLAADSDGVVIIDLEGVTRITSYGVREWMNALTGFPAQYLAFVNCHPPLVSQFNMVQGFAGRGELISLYLPYLCPRCSESFERLFDLRKHLADISRFVAPPVACPKCGTPAELDDLPESYLGYAAAQKLPHPPPLFDVLLAGTGAEANPGLRVVKEIVGRFTAIWLSGDLDARDALRRVADGLDGPLLFSMQGVTRFVRAGLSRITDLLCQLSIEVVLVDVPLELVEELAGRMELAGTTRIQVLSLSAPYRCPTHGVVHLPFTAEAFAAQAPPTASCPRCQQACERAFDASAQRALTVVHPTPSTPEVEAVLSHHVAKTSVASSALGRPLSPGGIGPGALIMGRYEYLRALGAGGMAEVFLARQTSLGGFEKLVVVKRILPGLAVDTGFVELFLQEARLAARVTHPNVVQIFDVGKESNQHFIVMEYVPGWDLHTLLASGVRSVEPCPVPVAARIAADMAAGLHAAHSSVDERGLPRPIIHRDVSPHNVMLSRDGHVKLTDFGIARAADAMNNTPTSVLKGKTPYIAPELIRAPTAANTTPLIDVFATGLVLYQMLTFEHPFKRDSELATFAALVGEAAPPPSALRADVPPELDAIIARAIAKDPSARYPSAQALGTALEAFLVHSGSPSDPSHTALWLKALEHKAPAGDGARSLATPIVVGDSDTTPITRTNTATKR